MDNVPRLLRFYVHPLLHAILPRTSYIPYYYVDGSCPDALWPILRLHGRKGSAVEEKEQFDGPGIGFTR